MCVCVFLAISNRNVVAEIVKQLEMKRKTKSLTFVSTKLTKFLTHYFSNVMVCMTKFLRVLRERSFIT